MGTGLHVERCASDVRRVHSHADWVRADALTHRKPLSRRLLGARAERVTAVRAWSGATSARALLGSPDDGAVCRGHCLSNYSVQGQAVLDYWVVAGETPREIVEAYAEVTGKVPMMPEYGLGFWQCKLRYQTQEELLGVAREYKRLELPIDVIVVDFFHWPKQGDWRFDETYWPDPGE